MTQDICTKVTPELSRAIQQLGFELGWKWHYDSKKIQAPGRRYLHLMTNNSFGATHEIMSMDKEVDLEDFLTIMVKEGRKNKTVEIALNDEITAKLSSGGLEVNGQTYDLALIDRLAETRAEYEEKKGQKPGRMSVEVTPTLSKLLQEKAFSLGYSWVGSKQVKYEHRDIIGMWGGINTNLYYNSNPNPEYEAPYLVDLETFVKNLELTKGEVTVECAINDEYKAIFKDDKVTIGCQTFELAAIDRLSEEKEKLCDL